MGNCCTEERTNAAGDAPTMVDSHKKPQEPIKEGPTFATPAVTPYPTEEPSNINHTSTFQPVPESQPASKQNTPLAADPAAPVPDVTQAPDVKSPEKLTKSQLAASFASSQFISVPKMNDLSAAAEAKYKQLGPYSSATHASEKALFSPRSSTEKGTYLMNTVDGSTYEGEVKQGVPNGFGKAIYSNGGMVEGFFKEGIPSGSVRKIHSTGAVYEGKMSNHFPNGPGTFTDDKGKNFKVEEWRNGDMYGKAIITALNGKVLFNGNLDKNARVGQGELTDELGTSHYVGTFVNNLMSGKGILKKNNGYIYDGEFLKNVEHGQGTLTTVDGRKIIGTFANGKPDGNCTLISDNGRQIKTIWKNGVKVGTA